MSAKTTHSILTEEALREVEKQLDEAGARWRPNACITTLLRACKLLALRLDSLEARGCSPDDPQEMRFENADSGELLIRLQTCHYLSHLCGQAAEQGRTCSMLHRALQQELTEMIRDFTEAGERE